MSSANNYKPLQTGFTRVFIIPGRARPDHRPEYMSSLKMTGVSQSRGDVTKVEIPDPTQYDKYIEVDQIRGQVERAKFSLVGRYAASIRSRLLELAQAGRAVDIQCHIGACKDPSDFNQFEKAVICENSDFTNHSTDDLGSLESGEGAVVNETGEISAESYYEVTPLTFTQRAGDLVTNQINAVAVSEPNRCQDTDGTKHYVFAVSIDAGGSPGTPPDIYFSSDSGNTWQAHDIETLLTTEAVNGVAVAQDSVIVVSNQAISMSYAAVQDFLDGIDPVFTEVTAGFVAGGKPKAIHTVGNKAFIVGDAGYVYFAESPDSGVTVLDAGVATVDDLYAVDALNEENAVAVGECGAVIFTTDKYSWDVAATRPVGYGVSLNSVCMISESEWIVAASDGKLYYTLNAGKKWTPITLPGSTPVALTSVVFANKSVGYVVGTIAGTRARMWRTFDGGYSWVVMPEKTNASMPLADNLLAVACSKVDANFVVTGGLADNGSDGIIIVGK